MVWRRELCRHDVVGVDEDTNFGAWSPICRIVWWDRIGWFVVGLRILGRLCLHTGAKSLGIQHKSPQQFLNFRASIFYFSALGN
jgi:hypothetical protein